MRAEGPSRETAQTSTGQAIGIHFWRGVVCIDGWHIMLASSDRLRLGMMRLVGKSIARHRLLYERKPRVTLGSQGEPALTRGYIAAATSWLRK